MNLLIIHWGAYTHADILQTLDSLHIHYQVIPYHFQDKNHDEQFEHLLQSAFMTSHYDAVFTVNYFPVIAQVCHHNSIKYLSWSYDCPLNVYDIEETLGLSTNYVFLFDRVQADKYISGGFQNIYHLPLAVNPERLNSITLSTTDYSTYHSDISFVGNLYDSTYTSLVSSLNDYTRGFLDSLIESQLNTYGCFFIDEMLTDTFMNDINKQYSGLQLTKEELSYAMASYATHKERLLLLSVLSGQYPLKLYSSKPHPLFPAPIYQGKVDYMATMPKIFKADNINLNITVKNTSSGIPLRALDIMGCGGFLLSNAQPELLEYFIPETDFAYYTSAEDALEKADYYLANEDIRKQIARNGMIKCQQLFNYKKQLCAILDTANLCI